MASVHLTDVVVSRLKTPGIYYDTTTPAFGVRVGKHRKAWIITKGTDRQRITIGQYPAMSLAEARKEAKKRLADDSPRSGRVTFEEAYDDYKTVIATKKPRTQRDYNRMLGKHLLPKLRKKQLTDIVYDDVTAVLEKEGVEKFIVSWGELLDTVTAALEAAK